MRERTTLALIDTLWLMEELGCTESDPWGGGAPITADEVEAAHPQEDAYLPPKAQSRSWHAGRIRYLAGGSVQSPVDLEVGWDARVHLEDGHHRLHAAHLFRRSRMIEAEVFGFVDDLPPEARASTA